MDQAEKRYFSGIQFELRLVTSQWSHFLVPNIYAFNWVPYCNQQ